MSADAFEIHTLLNRLAYATDRGTVEEYLACFTDEPSLARAGTEPRVGAAAFREAADGGRAAKMIGPESHTVHLVTPIEITVDGDTATSLSRWVFFGDADATPTVKLVGLYHDELSRGADGWRVASRIIEPG